MTRYDALMELEFPELTHTYTTRDTILYALGVGAGDDPVDPFELRLSYEPDLISIPSMAVTLGYPGFWYRDLNSGLNFASVLHASEHVILHAPLPVAATVKARPKIVAIHDKGEGRGSLVVSRRDVVEVETGQRLATVSQTAFCRGDGGLGGPVSAAPAPQAMPDRAPDQTQSVLTDPRSALIYRLSGDPNPLHVDPQEAKDVGFPGPILHGLSTQGHIVRRLMRLSDPLENPIVELDCRFTGVVYPGDDLQLEIWTENDLALWRVFTGERRVIDNGWCRFSTPLSRTTKANA